MAEIEKKDAITDDTAVADVAEVTEAPAEEAPAKAKKDTKKKKAKPNFFVRIGRFFVAVGRRIAKFFRDYNSERKKVVWKPWAEVCKSAAIVVVTVVAFSAVIYGVDEAFGNLFLWLAKIINP